MRAVGRRLLPGGTAQHRRKSSGFVERIAFDDFVAGDDDGALGPENARRQRLQASSDGRTRLSTRVERPRSMPASALRISPGSEMKTGPVGGVVAILAARRTMRGRSSRRVTSTAHLTSGSAIRSSGP